MLSKYGKAKRRSLLAISSLTKAENNNMQTNQAYEKHTNTKARKSYHEAQHKGKANKPARGKERDQGYPY
jgi:hypothetical protein